MIKAFIFDNDGVVSDSEEPDTLAWKRIMKEEGINITAEEYKSFSGKTGIEIVKSYIPNITHKEAVKFQDKKELYFIKAVGECGIKEVKGVKEFIEKLKINNYKIAMATAGTNEKVDFLFKELNLQNCFDVVVTANDVIHGKPHPEPFLKASEKLNISPEQCAVIEDSPLGIKAANKAGMLSIGITTSHTKEQLKEANIIIKTFEEIDLKNPNIY